MKIGMRRLQLFILLFAMCSLLFQLPSEAFASTPSDITATDAETDGEKSKFSIIDPEPEMDPEPEQTKKEKSKRQRR